MSVVVAFIVGAIFAVGLAAGGMLLPSKVIGFLDVTGDWDPTLVFVMGGAVLAFAVFFHVVRRERPLFADSFRLPTKTVIDRRLLGGSVLFGIGWGLAGYCPGPALVSLGSGAVEVLIFVAAMLAGMAAFAIFDRFASAKS